MYKLLFLGILSFNVFALTPSQQQMRDRLGTIENKYYALKQCNLLYTTPERNLEKILDYVAINLDAQKEACLLSKKVEIANRKLKFSQDLARYKEASNYFKSIDCNTLSDITIKNICIILQMRKL